MKKHINKIIIILIILNALIIGLVFAQSYKKTKTIKLEGNSLVSEVEITYDVQANPLSKVEIKDLSNTNAPINSCVGNLGQSLDISGNFFNFQLKEATVTMKYDEEKLGEVKEENLGILWYDKENEQMVEIETIIDSNNNTISFETKHFSEYIIVNIEEWKETWSERIVKIRDESESFEIAFVIDDSGSMTNNDADNRRLDATKEFINTLREDDEYSIIAFEYASRVEQMPTTDKDKIEEILKKFKSSGGTNIASGLTEGINLIKNSNKNNKIIVLLTDGEDNSLTTNKEQIIQEAINSNITLFTIFLNSNQSLDKQNSIDIQDIAVQTGGEFYSINSDEIIDIFHKINNVSVGTNNLEDTDGDGIPDEIELGGIRNQFGQIVYTNPYQADTDEDGKSDKEEIGDKAAYGNGIVYYKMNSDPTYQKDKFTKYTKIGPRKSYLGTWDSGFKLNKNAFKFRNIRTSITANGTCAGYSYIVEKIFNNEKIPKEVEDIEYEDISTEGDKKTTVKATLGYELTNDNLDIIFEHRLPYFYNPSSQKLKMAETMDGQEEVKYNRNSTEADDELINCLVYYWRKVNMKHENMFNKDNSEEKKVEEYDATRAITEDTINKLKLIFNNKKIVTVNVEGTIGHSINGYALEKISETIYRLYLYDSNLPYFTGEEGYIDFIKVPKENYYMSKYSYNEKYKYNLIDTTTGIRTEKGEVQIIDIEYNGNSLNWSNNEIEF